MTAALLHGALIAAVAGVIVATAVGLAVGVAAIIARAVGAVASVGGPAWPNLPGFPESWRAAALEWRQAMRPGRAAADADEPAT